MQSLKYNRTFHLPFSKGATNDDKIAKSIGSIIGVPIVISEKIDGSNASLEANGCFARTHSGPPDHQSFDWLKSLHANIKYKIPEGLQIFGENCYAKHSIYYNELPSYFLMFNIRDLNNNYWYSWEDVELWAKELELPTVPILFKGIIKSEKDLQKLLDSLMIEPSNYGGEREGVVVRIADQFKDEDFSSSIYKMVRENHVTTNSHWAHQEITANKLKII